ncbi:hypothetical protein LIER_36665 [Lithospermum erythrorhizon]|uniref:F-box associated beta-propeller type 3 domain-containing protein n=1 Tax=Lithospermum erythrorhizon TaxID=34254 RepID=A0AAV3PDR3_LITER
MKLVLSDEPPLRIASFVLDELGNPLLQFEEGSLKFPQPFDVSNFDPQIMCSCQGLLCLGFEEGFLLWNPITRTHHVFRKDPFREERVTKGEYVSVHGLGYDARLHDFKFIKVNQFEGHDENGINFESQVLVYSLNKQRWARLDSHEFSYNLEIQRVVTDVFVNGCLHYIVNKKNKGEADIIDSESLICAFNVSTETYLLIPKPSYVNLDHKFEVGVMDECLCMIVKENDARNFRLLEMREYGNGSSWMRPIASTENENRKHVLMDGDRKLSCFDVGNNSLSNNHYCNFEEVCVFYESQLDLDTPDDDTPTSDDDDLHTSDHHANTVE